MGLLFAELCVKQVAPGGRVGIILPNGYLGNRSPRYVVFREWLLRHTRLAAVIGFPRFTFKKSGADVSASVLVLEKRHEPLKQATDSEDYPFFAGILEAVGWSVSDKKSVPIYKRDPATGVQLTDSNNDRYSMPTLAECSATCWPHPKDVPSSGGLAFRATHGKTVGIGDGQHVGRASG